jgi:hypothetical protein
MKERRSTRQARGSVEKPFPSHGIPLFVAVGQIDPDSIWKFAGELNNNVKKDI